MNAASLSRRIRVRKFARVLAALLILSAVAVGIGRSLAQTHDPAPAPSPAQARRASTPPQPARSRTTQAVPAAAKRTSSTTAPAAANSASRRLRDVHIEGENAAPQVLFISPQDPRRVTDFQHQRYLATSRSIGEVGASTGIAVVDPSRDPSKRSAP